MATQQIYAVSTAETLETHLPNYLNWLEFSNIEAPYSKNTIRAYKRENKAFIDYLIKDDVLELSEINNHVLRTYFSNLAKNGNSSGTITAKLSAIDSFFEFLYIEDIIEENPITKYKSSIRRKGRGGTKKKRNPTVLYKEEINDIFDAIAEHNQSHYYLLRDTALIGLMLDTGLRTCELGSITVLDIEILLREGILNVVGKGDKERTIRPQTQYLDNLKAFYDEMKSTGRLGASDRAFFLTQQGKPFSQPTLFRLINRYLARAGINKNQNGGHLLRHTAASLLLSKTDNIRKVQIFLGHSSISTTERYTHII